MSGRQLGCAAIRSTAFLANTVRSFDRTAGGYGAARERRMGSTGNPRTVHRREPANPKTGGFVLQAVCIERIVRRTLDVCARRASSVLAGASQCNRRVCCKTKPGGSFPKNAAGGIPGLHGGTRTSEDPSLGDVACDLNCKIIRCVPGSFRSLRAWHRSFHTGSSFRRSFAEGPPRRKAAPCL